MQKNLLTKRVARFCEKFLTKYNGFSYDFHKNGEEELLQKLAKLSFKTVFDVGANVGDWSETANGFFPEAKIHAFELSPSTFLTLQKKLKAPCFILNDCGLSDQRGEIEYKDYGTDSAVSSLVLETTFHDQTTPSRIVKGRVDTGDLYCKDHNINKVDFLKIDVEGAEHFVLKGFSQLLQKGAIRIVQFEYGYAHGDVKFLMRDFYRLFEDYGYVVGRVTKGPIAFVPWTYKNNDFTSGPNYVAVRKDDKEIIQLLTV